MKSIAPFIKTLNALIPDITPRSKDLANELMTIQHDRLIAALETGLCRQGISIPQDHPLRSEILLLRSSLEEIISSWIIWALWDEWMSWEVEDEHLRKHVTWLYFWRLLLDALQKMNQCESDEVAGLLANAKYVSITADAKNQLKTIIGKLLDQDYMSNPENIFPVFWEIFLTISTIWWFATFSLWSIGFDEDITEIRRRMIHNCLWVLIPISNTPNMIVTGVQMKTKITHPEWMDPKITEHIQAIHEFLNRF